MKTFKTIVQAIITTVMMMLFITVTNINEVHARDTDWVYENAQSVQKGYKNVNGKKRKNWVKAITRSQAKKIVESVYNYSFKHNVDPDLVFKVMRVESRFNPNARSSAGAQGLMQVIPKYHREKLKGRNPFDIDASVESGILVLKEYIGKYGSVKRGLAAYNGSLRSDKYPNLVAAVKLPDIVHDNITYAGDPATMTIENNPNIQI